MHGNFSNLNALKLLNKTIKIINKNKKYKEFFFFDCGNKKASEPIQNSHKRPGKLKKLNTVL